MTTSSPEAGRNNIAGRRVKAARQKVGWTQDQLAAKLQVEGLDITQVAVSRLETGQRVVMDYELPGLAKALGVSIAWLLGAE